MRSYDSIDEPVGMESPLSTRSSDPYEDCMPFDFASALEERLQAVLVDRADTEGDAEGTKDFRGTENGHATDLTDG